VVVESEDEAGVAEAGGDWFDWVWAGGAISRETKVASKTAPASLGNSLRSGFVFRI